MSRKRVKATVEGATKQRKLTIWMIALEILSSVSLAVALGVAVVVSLRGALKIAPSPNQVLENWILELVGTAFVVSFIIIFLNVWKRILKRYFGVDS